MISNEERRGVAQKLRSLDEYIDGMPSMCTKQEHDAMALGAIRAVVGKGDIFHLLADLIDRPTCEVLYYEQESSNKMAKPCEAADADFVQCGNCENWMQWVWDYENHNWCAPKYCSCCGAEVIE